MKEKILSTFKNLGFLMEDMQELGYGFDYEGLHYLWLNYDDEFLNIAIPAVLNKSDLDELAFYQVINRVNATLRYVKANEVGDSLWLFYEREMIGEEDFEVLLPHMILNLEHAVRFLRNGDQDANNDNDGDCIIGEVDLLSDNK